MSSSSASDEIRCIEGLLPYCLGRAVDAQALHVLREAGALAAPSEGASAQVLRAARQVLLEAMAGALLRADVRAKTDADLRDIAAFAVESRDRGLLDATIEWQRRRAEHPLGAAGVLDLVVSEWCRSARAGALRPPGADFLRRLSDASAGRMPDPLAVRRPVLQTGVRANLNQISTRSIRRDPAKAGAAADASVGKVMPR